MATVKQLTDWGVLHILTATIKGAYARRGWSSNALLPVVSALLAVGTYISEASVAGRPDCHGICRRAHAWPSQQTCQFRCSQRQRHCSRSGRATAGCLDRSGCHGSC